MDFITALTEHAFLQRALAAGLLVALGCGLVGPLAVVHQASLAGGAIAHGLLVGIGVAVIYDQPPLAGALVAALAAALLTGCIHLRFRQQQDVLLAAVWSAGMALGVVLFADRPGGGADLTSYLFGSILLVTPGELLMMMLLDGVLLVLVTLYSWQLISSGLDEDYARSRGVPVDTCYMVLLCAIACLVVLLLRVVGIALMIALIALPAAAALGYSRNLRQAMGLAVALAACGIIPGLVTGFYADKPPGAMIVLFTVAVYLLCTTARGLAQRH